MGRSSVFRVYRVSHSPPQGNGQVEDRQHHGSAVVGEQVSDDGGRDGRVAGLPDPHQASGEDKEPVVLQRERERAGSTMYTLLYCTCLQREVKTGPYMASARKKVCYINGNSTLD